MNSVWKEILQKISDESLQFIEKKDFAEKLGLSIQQLKEQLELLQDEGYLKFRHFTMTRWNVRITSEGYKYLNKISKK